jgi:uncharacterized protein (TIGR03382 family)
MFHRIATKLAAVSALVFAAACGSTPGEPIGSTDDALVTATGVDYSWARPSPSGLKSEGYTFAARYLSYDTTGKNLSASEANALWAAGVDVVVVWEQTATATLNGYNQGVSDAKAAEAQANADGAPAGRPIYFAIDFDASSSQQAAINDYFDGVASVIGVNRAGAYAGYYVIQRLFNAGKIKWGWQTYAWSYGNWDSRAQLRQVQNGITAAGDSNCCDKDEAVATDFGQWHAAPPNTAPRGYLDSADCTSGIAGWAQDQDQPSTAIDVHLYFDGPAGTSTTAMKVIAGDKRNDLCTAIGSCNHGYSTPVPVGLLDGKSHSVYAYGIDTQGGPNTELTNSGKTFTCPNATPPLDAKAGVKRHVVDPASMKSWGFTYLTDVAPEPDAVVSAYPQSADWSDAPKLVQADDGTPEVWLLDGEVRRHVVSPDSLAAWHQTFGDVVKTPAAKVYAYAQGADLPDKPFLVIGSGPAVYVIDSAPGTAPKPPGTDGGTSGDGGWSGNGDAGGGGGCSMQPSSPTGSWAFGLLLPLAVLVRRRRTSWRHAGARGRS